MVGQHLQDRVQQQPVGHRPDLLPHTFPEPAGLRLRGTGLDPACEPPRACARSEQHQHPDAQAHDPVTTTDGHPHRDRQQHQRRRDQGRGHAPHHRRGPRPGGHAGHVLQRPVHRRRQAVRRCCDLVQPVLPQRRQTLAGIGQPRPPHQGHVIGLGRTDRHRP
ncbi:hypothetical protein N869_05035 [Cellulomonas bogoriensis 69B4 = DSM 16987]|uniref:Uncharacterized protein n=1 Tax=Cellulomonas bogoriensis 69B4 = DSM 16987 TaxID=1386082 RepID=A0A0A0BQ93_9CELL|nr:hypothetical protein [Cellulomonas bogoriensis]KGM10141.1 hypothetical protein N869_05035 [Cellulomonas bogoriensis 69B4 = DSM 16987]